MLTIHRVTRDGVRLFEIEETDIKDIEITSWKARAYGIFTRVGEVSEIERVRFLIQNQRV